MPRFVPSLVRFPLPLLILCFATFSPILVSRVTCDTVRFGVFLDPTTPPSTDLDSQFVSGLQLAFTEQNSLAQICNRTLTLASFTLDDVMSRTLPNDVVAMVGPIKAAENVSLFLKRMTSLSVPFLAPLLLEGADLQSRLPLSGSPNPNPNPNLIPLRASRRDEVLALFRYFRIELEIEPIVVLYEVGFVTDLELQAVRTAANASGLMLLGSFPIDTTGNVAGTLQTVTLTTAPIIPEAVIIVASCPVASSVISQARQTPTISNARFGVVTLCDPSNLTVQMDGNTTNVYLTQILPLPTASDSLFTKAFQNALGSYSAPGLPVTAFTMEGYLAGRVIIQWLRNLRPRDCAEPLTGDFLKELINSCCVIRVDDLELGPFHSDSCLQGLRKVWILAGNSTAFASINSNPFSLTPSCSIDPNSFGPKALVFGQSAPFSGPSGPNGPQLEVGIRAAFAEQNRLGGILNRKLHLISLDDGYTVPLAYTNTKAFLRYGVHGLVGYYGSAISNNVSILASQANVAYFAPYTGTLTIRGPTNYNRNIINLRASYQDEIVACVKFATQSLDLTRFSIFYQSDIVGTIGLAALTQALEAVNLRIMSKGSYPINTVQISDGLELIIRDASPFTPQAVIVWATNAAAAAFIKAAKLRLPSSTVYFGPSFVGAGFISEFPDRSTNIYVSQVFPLYADKSYHIASEYDVAMKNLNPQYTPSMVSFETYIDGRTLIRALQSLLEPDLGQPSRLVDAVYSIPIFAISDLLLGPFTNTCNQGMKKVWLSLVSAADYLPLANATLDFSATKICLTDMSLLPVRYVVFGQSASFTNPLVTAGYALQAGLLAAFHQANRQSSISGTRFHLWSLDDQYNATKTVINTNAFLRERVYGLIGYLGTETANAVSSLVSEQTPFIAPATGAMSFRQNSPYVINLRASYFDEMNALIHFGASLRGLTRFSIFYQNDAFGRQGLSAIQAALSAISLSLVSAGTYDANSEDISTGFLSVFPDSLVRQPQAVIVWAVSLIAAKFIIQAKATRVDGSKMIFLCPSVVGERFLSFIGVSYQNVFVSQILPPISDHPLAVSFSSAMTDAGFSFASLSGFSLEGYAAGRLVTSVLSSATGNSSFTDALYSSRYFDINTLDVGPYLRGSCNQGLHSVWISSCGTNGTSYENVPRSTFQFAQDCVSNPTTSLFKPLMFGFITTVGDSSRFLSLKAALDNSNSLIEIPEWHLHAIQLQVGGSATSISSQIDQLMSDYDLTGFITDITDPPTFSAIFAKTSSANMTLVSIRGPIVPSVHQPFSTKRVFLGGSPRDEAFAMLRFISQTLLLKKIGLVQTNDAIGAEVLDSVTLAIEEYDCELVSTVSITGGVTSIGSVADAVLEPCPEVLIVSASVNTLAIVQQLQSKGHQTPIFLFSSDSDSFSAQAGGGSDLSMNNIYTSQFLPAPRSVSSVVVAQAAAALITQFGSSVSFNFTIFAGYFTGMFIVEVVKILRHRSRIVPQDISDAIYSGTIFPTDISLGPFVSQSCHSYSKDPHCECDLGSRNVWIHRLSSNSTIRFEEIPTGRLYFDTCEVTPSAKPQTTSRANSESARASVIILVVVGSVFAACVIGVVLVVYITRRRKKIAALKLAPSGLVTLAFSDVEGSTRLWETYPDLMRKALDTHNINIRALITRYKGYEVKTQGDSFMVAFEDATAAVAWSLDVQEALLEADWPEELLQEPSCAVVTSGHELNECGQPILLFRGLRVRIGIHTGFPDVEYNPRTNSVDYFGPMVNCAARIEALGAGGQVLMSKDSELVTEMLPNVWYVSLGKVPLKGISEKQEVIQVLNERMALRKFPDLDRSKVEEAAVVKGPQRCHTCSRPLTCNRCANISNATSFIGIPGISAVPSFPSGGKSARKFVVPIPTVQVSPVHDRLRSHSFPDEVIASSLSVSNESAAGGKSRSAR